MSELLQSGQHPGASGHHPDADQLSAFLERALPAHEREHVLAHLAVCPDCRETVALSLPASEVPQTAAAAPRRPWFSGWAIFVPAAAALAATIFFVVSIHRANTGSAIPVQQSRIVIPQQPAQANAPPAQPDAGKPRHLDRLSSAAVARSIASSSSPSPVPGHAQSPRMAMLAPPPPAQAPEGAAAEIAKPATAPAAATGGAMAVIAPEPKATNAPLGSANQTVAVTQEAPMMKTTPDSLELRLAQPAAHAVVFKRPLPSGLTALSAVQNGRAILAIDTHNALFRSDDSGGHWIAVPAPWQGRAVKVDLVSYPAASAGVLGELHGEGMATFANAARLPSPLRPSQWNASLTGLVKDATGAAIPGAAVTITNLVTNAERKVAADANGHYLADNLAQGNYSISAQAPGFVAERNAGIMLDSSKQMVANLTLQVGTSAESVNVQAASPQLGDIAAEDKKTAMAPAAAPPPAVFAITTDTGERWTSADGIAWTRK
jgi:hypothetical protein